MPSLNKQKIWKTGNSWVVTVSKSYVDDLQSTTKKENPDVDVIVDTVALIIPKDVPIDDDTVLAFIAQQLKNRSKETKK